MTADPVMLLCEFRQAITVTAAHASVCKCCDADMVTVWKETASPTAVGVSKPRKAPFKWFMP